MVPSRLSWRGGGILDEEDDPAAPLPPPEDDEDDPAPGDPGTTHVGMEPDADAAQAMASFLALAARTSAFFAASSFSSFSLA